MPEHNKSIPMFPCKIIQQLRIETAHQAQDEIPETLAGVEYRPVHTDKKRSCGVAAKVFTLVQTTHTTVVIATQDVTEFSYCSREAEHRDKAFFRPIGWRLCMYIPILIFSGSIRWRYGVFEVMQWENGRRVDFFLDRGNCYMF